MTLMIDLSLLRLVQDVGFKSSVAREQGFLVAPIDCPQNQHKTKVRVISLDLTSPHADSLLRRLVKEYRVIAVHGSYQNWHLL